ncbi:CCA tRNA nucleotidyltransferase [Bacillus kwashiorkori]|uniref:CCA tRNA nucleotidyltransferase n=1 Tax=Bacillus kwashiorkori TaxID=1522318 RepID=UPI0007863E1B|nr:CCA tRNA nucleotidyltransferase [Bacillus kwashiorkori]
MKLTKPFLQAIPLIEEIENAGYEAYFVGGSVRDYLLGKAINDVDIATSAHPEEIKAIFPKTVDVGIEHGTVLVLFQNNSYEITTFRSESEYVDFRRPKEVKFIRSLEEDLQRRDFTMNAIAMTKAGELIDPFSGYSDIKSKIIRTVGSPHDRFQEDALRLLRAVRFVSQLNFQLDSQTFQALKRKASLLEHIAVERKLAEFIKLLNGRNRKEAMELLVEGTLNQFLPGLVDKEDGLREFSQNCNQNDDFTNDEWWTLLIYFVQPENITRFLKSWKLPVKKMKKVDAYYRALLLRFNDEFDELLIYKLGLEVVISAEKINAVIKKQLPNLHILQKKYERLPIKDRSQLKINGNDIITWMNKSSGPWVKDELRKVEEAVIKGEVANEKSIIKEWLYS